MTLRRDFEEAARVKSVPYHPWLISKLRDPIDAAHYLMAAAKDSREAFLKALRNINEACEDAGRE